MRRREWLKTAAGFGIVTAVPPAASAHPQDVLGDTKSSAAGSPLGPPTSGSIPVAFRVSKDPVVIDLAGPWEVFQKTKVPGRQVAFHPYTVAKTTSSSSFSSVE